MKKEKTPALFSRRSTITGTILLQLQCTRFSKPFSLHPRAVIFILAAFLVPSSGVSAATTFATGSSTAVNNETTTAIPTTTVTAAVMQDAVANDSSKMERNSDKDVSHHESAGIQRCSLRQFECDNGRCVPQSWVCEGENDCGDNSDEKPSLCPPNKACDEESEFRCSNGRCIPLHWQCDNERDCADGSDENPHICQSRPCEKGQFQCYPGFCISENWVCDRHMDCPNGADEHNCNDTCRSDEFTCQNGRCIQKSWVCDNDDDCGDATDEKNCSEMTCNPLEQFTCSDNTCISLRWRCDGDFDCYDHSDEQNCPNKIPASSSSSSAIANIPGLSHCLPNEFECGDRLTCIDKSWLCDGEKDCPDGADESIQYCKKITCRADQFQCDNHQCIPGYLHCSGKPECTDGSDEFQCESTKPKCAPEKEFDCGDGMCIPWKKVCDKHADCPNAEDEPTEGCGIDECSVNNGNCSHTCVNQPISYRCECKPGYALLADNHTCEDIDECQIPGTCSQLCTNLKGGFKCECVSGYTRDANDHTRCKALDGHASLLFSRRHDIRKISLDRNEMSSIVNETKSATALDFVFRTGMVFWSDVAEHKIYKAPIDEGSERTVVVSNDVTSADGLAVDWIYSHIYWTNSEKKVIELSNYEGNMRKTLIKSSLEEPRGIALDPINGWMFWTDWGSHSKIERAGMDGSHRRAIVTYDVKWPNGLTIDLVKSRIYWVDAKLNTISSCDYEGYSRSVVLYSKSALQHPFSITTFEDWLYWTDWEKKTIFKANKFTGKNLTHVTPLHTLQNPMVVHVYHPYRQPDGVNYCAAVNGHCSHLCLPAPHINQHSPKISCACPDGLLLMPDLLMCAEDDSEQRNDTNTEVDTILLDTGANGGFMAAAILLAITLSISLLAVAAFAFYRHVLRRSMSRMNFDNPVYRKTTEDQFSLEKSSRRQQHTSSTRSYPSSYVTEEFASSTAREPLTGGSEYV